LRVGFALETELGSRGRTIWDEWSAGCSLKFNHHEQDRAWSSFKRDGITIGTLFKYARDAGWRPAPPSKPSTGAPKKRVPDQCEGIEYVGATNVTMSAIRWLWPNRIAIGKLTLIAGMPDEGKSQIVCDIVARLTTTRGDKHWPCKEGVAPIGNAIMFSAEDDPGDTLKPRLLAAGADCDRVMLANMVRTKDGRRMFDVAADIGQLRTSIKTMPDTRLISFDPLNAYFGHGRVDTFRNSDVRAVLGPLADLAAELEVAIIGLLHFNKKADLTSVMLRMGDSIAFSAAARAVYAVVPDEENKRKLLIKGKNNLAPTAGGKTLAYSSEPVNVGTDPESGETITAPHIVWYPNHVDVSASEAMQAAAENRSPVQIESAMELLTDLLSEGAVNSDEIKKAAEAHQITAITLRRARERVAVEMRKESGSLHGKWYWRLPNRDHPWPWDVRQATVGER
jgi:putative DNA primase/helicase